MIVYRDARRETDPRAELQRLRHTAAAMDATAFLVGVGELEQGLVDALRPRADGWGRLEAALREAARQAGAAYLAARAGRPPRTYLRHALAELESIARGPLPHDIAIRPPEGYVHYALDPAGFAAAAETYRAETGARRAARGVVVGVRSIGTSLSAVVATTTGSTRTVTVRPRGESGSRRIIADRALCAHLAPWLHDDADVLVVDEGPGATGETLAVVAAWLRSLGVDERRIVLFPSSAWGMPLAPQERRAWFAAARKYVPPLVDSRPTRIARRLGLSPPEDLSGGRWRDVVDSAADEPACVAHERCKHRARDAAGTAYLMRYAGLGRWGEAVAARADRLAAAGVGPASAGITEGFLLRRWIDGVPVRFEAGRDPAFLAALAGYLCARAPLFRTGREVEASGIIAMLRANTAEAFGAAAPGLADAARRLERLPAREAVVCDGRLQPREWLRTATGYHKVDALDHGDGLRLPGPTDAAWDLAGAAVEFALDDAVTADLTRRVAAAGGGSAAELAEAVTAYRAPYSAVQLGDATLSAREATSEQDRRRLEAEVLRYRGALGRELQRARLGPTIRLAA